MNTFRWYDWGVAPFDECNSGTAHPAGTPGEVPWGMTGVGRFRSLTAKRCLYCRSCQRAVPRRDDRHRMDGGRDYVNHTGSLNNFQAAANPDGSITYVIAARDPGVQNWLDTDGLHEGVMLLRWEMLRTTPDPIKAVRDVKVVKLGDVAATLPFPTPNFTTEQRRNQIRGARRRPRATLGGLVAGELNEESWHNAQ